MNKINNAYDLTRFVSRAQHGNAWFLEALREWAVEHGWDIEQTSSRQRGARVITLEKPPGMRIIFGLYGIELSDDIMPNSFTTAEVAYSLIVGDEGVPQYG